MLESYLALSGVVIHEVVSVIYFGLWCSLCLILITNFSTISAGLKALFLAATLVISLIVTLRGRGVGYIG